MVSLRIGDRALKPEGTLKSWDQCCFLFHAHSLIRPPRPSHLTEPTQEEPHVIDIACELSSLANQLPAPCFRHSRLRFQDDLASARSIADLELLLLQGLNYELDSAVLLPSCITGDSEAACEGAEPVVEAGIASQVPGNSVLQRELACLGERKQPSPE
eukprot:1179758-Prorocentrum_minimum.AAC.1